MDDLMARAEAHLGRTYTSHARCIADSNRLVRDLLAEVERLRPVVEAARAFVALYPHSTPSLAPEWTALRAALEAHDA